MTKKIPKWLNCKTLVDDFEAYHNAHDGTLFEDYIKVSKDLEKLSKIPLLDKNGKTVKYGIEDKDHLVAPFRKVKVLFNTNFGSGRVLGYSVTDNLCEIRREGGRSLKKSFEEWYKDATQNWGSGSAPTQISQRRYTLKQLDNLKI